jgi:S-disulfanyl-L-cysteine oxidoreductase SoxD
MSMPKRLIIAACVTLFPACAGAQSVVDHYGFGRTPTAQETEKYFAIPPSGKGLPPGSGTAKAGAEIFAQTCAACHGDKLQGNPAAGVGGDRLIGGRGSLATKTPLKTVESYWPYSTTLFDYIKRAMPFSAPGSLTDDQVYSVVAYILSESHVIKPTDVIDAESLPKIAMPNRDGFIPDDRPELELYK